MASQTMLAGRKFSIIGTQNSHELIILTQSCVMTARIEMKSSESEAPIIGDMVKATSQLVDVKQAAPTRINTDIKAVHSISFQNIKDFLGQVALYEVMKTNE